MLSARKYNEDPKTVYDTYCFKTSGLDGKTFLKFCKDSHKANEVSKHEEIDLIFAKCKEPK
jgi:hypothetical protein